MEVQRPRVTLSRERVTALQEASGIPTDAELAKRLGLSTKALSELFNGKREPTLGTLLRLKVLFPATPGTDFFLNEHTTPAGHRLAA